MARAARPGPAPSRWRIEFCEPIDLSAHRPEAAEDQRLVFDLSEQVRETIQQKLYDNLVKRRLDVPLRRTLASRRWRLPAATVRATTGTRASCAPRRDARRARRALAAADADERIGPLLRATGLAMRFDFPDAGIDAARRRRARTSTTSSWSFAEAPEWQPKLELEMSAEVANRYLQGSESLAIAIARGQVRCRGESRAALLYLPAARLICEPYRRVVEADFPDLARPDRPRNGCRTPH